MINSKKHSTETREGEAEFFKFLLVDEDGKSHEITAEAYEKDKMLNRKERVYHSLREFVDDELGKPKERGEPPHIKLMKQLELVDYCEVSDSGHFKWHPNGVLIKELILTYQDRLAREYGAFKIENPLIYRLEDGRIRQLIGEFAERLYSWEENGSHLILRPASDPGQFPYAQSLTFSYKQLPLKQYEEAPCFRKEQKGELSGLRRVRNFLMTDLHVFAANEEQAKEEFETLSFLCKDIMDSIVSDGTWVLGWEATEDYWEENQAWMEHVTAQLGVPALVKLMKERSHYFHMKNEFQAIHPNGLATQVSTVQIDKVNGERFDITYTGRDNEEHPCTLLHCSTFGSIERTLTTLLEDALRAEKPMLPMWLAPTQVRFIPVNEEMVPYADKVADDLEASQIRVDIDDQADSVSRKIRRAERAWIPVIIVVGSKEKETGNFKPRLRKEGTEQTMQLNEIVDYVQEKTGEYPYHPLALPRRLSKRPKFVG